MQLAVERLVEIIGEAARNVSEPFKQSHPIFCGKGSSDSAMFSA